MTYGAAVVVGLPLGFGVEVDGHGLYAAGGYAPRTIDGTQEVTMAQAVGPNGLGYETLHFERERAGVRAHRTGELFLNLRFP